MSTNDSWRLVADKTPELKWVWTTQFHSALMLSTMPIMARHHTDTLNTKIQYNEPTSGPYPKPDESSPYPPILPLYNPF